MAVSLIGLSAQTTENPQWYVGGPWDKALFSTDLAALRQAADANRCPNPQSVTVFFSEGNTSFKADGSLERHSKLVYRVENDDGVKNWSDISVSYSPWHEGAPTMRVRILNPDGKVFEISEKDLIEASTGDSGDQMYSDQKRLKAPYPNVMVGSIIEEELVEYSRPYLSSSGMEDQWFFSRRNAVGLNRYVVTYPNSLNLQFKAASMDSIAVQKTQNNGQTTLIWEIKNQAPGNNREDYVPPENRQRPVVVVGSAPSWAAIAEAYSKEIESVLAKDDLAMPKDLSLPRNNAQAATLAASNWLNSKVRYTGMELGQNSIIPFPPAKVLARGYGDCKDKATMVVSLLRKSGYKAWVSLIRTGPGWDIDPSISGMTSFNHAIVYVDEGKGFWFDPTIEINRDTALPYHDQYRYTLIARPGQKQPLRTPLASGADNQVRETREITMAEDGKGSIVETTEYFGAYDSYYRNLQPYQDPKKVRESMESYADNYYGSKKVDKVEWSNPRDFAKPISLTLAAKEINRSFTGDTNAEVSYHLNNLRSYFSDNLLDEKDPKRTQPYRFNLPFSYKLIVNIHQPAGFQARAVPESVEIKNAVFSFKRSWEAKADGGLLGTTYFELTKYELSPAEFASLRTDLKKLLEDQNQQTLNFDHQAESLRAEGRYAEAFESYRTLLKANPNSAIQNKRLSVALLSYSLGQPAVFYARKATELDPKNATMWANLATMLMHDGLGRRLNKGYDQPGSITAWKKAIELDPENKAHQANLAILYEYNATGDRYQDPESLKLARAEYLGLGKSLDDYELVLNLWHIEIRLGNYAQAKELIPRIKDEANRNVAKVITEIMLGNPQSPMKSLEQNLALEKRQNYLAACADHLVALRRYADAAKVLRQAAVANKNASYLENRADTLDRLRNFDKPDVDSSTPEGAVKNFLFAYLTRSSQDPALLSNYFAKSFQEMRPNYTDKRLFTYLDHLITPMVGGGSARLLADVTLSLLSYEASSDDAGGSRVNTSFEGVTDTSFQFYLIKEGNTYKIVSWAPLYTVIGKQILSFIDAGKTQSAAKWYNWIFPPSQGKNYTPLSPNFFTDDQLPRSAWLMRQVNQILAIAGRQNGQAAQDIARIWGSLSKRDAFIAQAKQEGIPSDQQANLWNALSYWLADTAQQNQVYDTANEIAKTLVKFMPKSQQFSAWLAHSQTQWGEGAAAEASLEALQTAKPDDREAFDDLLRVYQLNLNFAKMDALSAKYPTRLSGMDLNNLAWDELFRNPNGSLAPIALERSRKSVNLSQSKSRPELHTLATIYATIGRYDEARSVLAKVIELNPGNEPSSDDWYVIGLIADGYGFHDAAVEAWRKVVRDEDSVPHKTDTYLLAQAKLK